MHSIKTDNIDPSQLSKWQPINACLQTHLFMQGRGLSKYQCNVNKAYV